MKIGEYLFRHDRGTFWTVERKFPLVQSAWFRWLFGWALDSRLRRLSILSNRGSAKEEERERKRVVQDPIVPMQFAVEALYLMDELFGIEPIWLCPFKVLPLPSSTLLVFPPQHLFYLDIGLYAAPTTANYDAVTSHRRMEKFLRDFDGFLAPYAVNYSTVTEFWSVYHKELYDSQRLATKADGSWVDLFKKIGGGEKIQHLNTEEDQRQLQQQTNT